MSLALMFLFACSPDNIENDKTSEETPGDIPGMGDTEGELEISDKFVLPEGLLLVSITGINNPIPEDDINTSSLKNISQQNLEYEPAIGSGTGWIALKLIFENTTNTNKDILIPRGCLFEALEEGYQNSILAQDVRINILRNQQIQIKLYLYCINKGENGSDETVQYKIRGVTESKWMQNLIEALENKKIGIDYFTEAEKEEYKNIANSIQEIVWAITDGTGLSQENWDFIDKLSDK